MYEEDAHESFLMIVARLEMASF